MILKKKNDIKKEKLDVKPVEKIKEVTVKNLVEPIRPLRQDFKTYEEHLKAKEIFAKKREEYTKNIENAIKYDLEKERKYSTKEKILEWSNKNNIKIHEDVFKEIDLRVFDETITTMEKTFEKYPFLKEFNVFDEISGKTVKHDFNIGVMRDNGLLEANDGLKFGKSFKNYEIGLRKSLEQMTNGFNVNGNGKFGTLINHEIGHTMEVYISRIKKNSTYYEELLKLKNLKGISEYATFNTSELFAEGFAEYMNGDSEFGIEFGKFLS